MRDTQTAIKSTIQNLFFSVITNSRCVYFLILALGIFARLWEFGKIPSGLNQDEASIGLDAYSLFHFGVDRMGVSFPVNFISWGSGMDALYGYMLLPFMPFSLTPLIVRLPSLITGILSIPLLYYVARESFGESAAKISMFLLAVSPWHIMLSRWGLNENILPFVFLLGYAFLIKSQKENNWFVISLVFFAACLYAYAASYVAVPIFLIFSVAILLKSGRLSIRNLAIGLSIFTALIMPLILFVYINLKDLNSIHLGLIVIPKLPVVPRMFRMIASNSATPIKTSIGNIIATINLLAINRSDGLIWNSMPLYGYLYSYSLPFILTGMALLLKDKSKYKPENLLLISWLIASLCIGLAQNVNFNRIHLIFIPLILCAAICLDWIGKCQKFALTMLILALMASFAAFTSDYHGDAYSEKIGENFHNGLLSAITYARQSGDGTICITDHINMPYIYAQFSQPTNPSEYLNDIQYIEPEEEFRRVRSFGRYVFGIEYCPKSANTVYILLDESPENPNGYTAKEFYDFCVYMPK